MNARLRDLTATVTTRELVMAVAGISFLWTLFRGNFFGELVMYGMEDREAEVFYYGCFLAATAVVPLLLISSKSLDLIHELGHTRWFPVAMALLTGAGCLLMALCTQDRILFPYLLPLGGFFTALGLFGTLPIWAQYLAGKPRAGILSLLLSSMAISCIVSLLLSLAQHLGFTRPMFLFAIVPGLAYALLPEDRPRFELAPGEAREDFELAASHPQSAVISLMLFLVIGAMAKGCAFHQGGLDFGDAFTAAVTFLILIIVIIIATVAHHVRSIRGMVKILWLALVVVYVVGLLSILSSIDLPYVGCFITATRYGLLFFLILLLVLYVRVHPDHGRQAFGIFIACQTASALISYCIVPALLEETSITLHDIAVIALCLLIIPIVYVVLMLLKREDGHVPQHDAPTEQGALLDADMLAQARARLRASYGLTPREDEILALLYQATGTHGEAVEAVASELVISAYTVRTHVKHIYSKLGVHSREELITRIEEAAREE